MSLVNEMDEDELLCPDNPSTKDIMDLLFTIKKDTSHANKTLESTNNKLSEYISSSNKKFENVTSELNKNSSQIKQLNDKIKSCETLANSVNYAFELQKQKALKNNISIYGLPCSDNENLMEIVCKVFGQLNIEVMSTDIQTCYRVKGKFKIVVVKCVDFGVKDKIMKAKLDKVIKVADIFPDTSAENNTNIFINNHTTPYFGRLLFHGRKAVKDNIIHSCWITSNGFYVKKTNESKPKEIKFMNELLSMVNSSNNSNGGTNGNGSGGGDGNNELVNMNGNDNGNVNSIIGNSSNTVNCNNNINERSNNRKINKRGKPDEKSSPNELMNQKSKLRNNRNTRA